MAKQDTFETKPEAAGEQKEHSEWAKAKKHLVHLPSIGNEPPALLYTNPLYAAAKTMKRWVIGSQVNEADYDAALKEAGDTPIHGGPVAAKAAEGKKASEQ